MNKPYESNPTTKPESPKTGTSPVIKDPARSDEARAQKDNDANAKHSSYSPGSKDSVKAPQHNAKGNDADTTGTGRAS